MIIIINNNKNNNNYYYCYYYYYYHHHHHHHKPNSFCFLFLYSLNSERPPGYKETLDLNSIYEANFVSFSRQPVITYLPWVPQVFSFVLFCLIPQLWANRGSLREPYQTMRTGYFLLRTTVARYLARKLILQFPNFHLNGTIIRFRPRRI